MLKQITNNSEYFSKYRKKIGFANQSGAKNFLGAKDVTPTVDLNFIKLLNERLCLMINKINEAVVDEIKIRDMASFKKEYIDETFEIMKNNNILPRLNNQGRRPEQVYFSWMRGYVLVNYFLKALGLIFEVDTTKIELIGDDDLKKIDTFKRTAKADLEIELNKNEKIRIEMQTGFTGINDIKKHKVVEAKKVFNKSKIQTLVIHFDLYNGQVAFVKLNEIDDKNINWVERKQMEGQIVFNIDQKFFIWNIIEKPVRYKDIKFE